MCTNKTWIKNFYTGEKVLVDCGKCPSCLQAKADKRTTRINMQSKFDVPDGYTTLFLTLTYDNDTIPYILKSDFESFILGGNDFLPVYRDYKRFVVRDKDDKKNNKRTKKRVTSAVFEPIAIYNNYDIPNGGVDYRCFYNSQCSKIEELDTIRYTCYRGKKRYFEYDSERIGVIYYHDIQLFIKRLRIYLKRHYNYDEKLHFFACSEYGPESRRPHHHLLLHIPEGFIEKCKDAVVQAWQFDDMRLSWRQERQIKVATNAAAYVSSYVNCDSSLSFFLKTFKPFKPKHNYSYGYGMSSNLCQLSSLLQMSEKRDFSYQRDVKINGIPTTCNLPIPSYIINRYFPKFKGFSRLPACVSLDIIQCPARLKEWANALDFSLRDIHNITVSLRNHYQLYCDCLGLDFNQDVNLYLYAYDFVKVHSRFYSFLNKYSYYDLVSVEDYLYHFINWNTPIKHALRDYLLSVYKNANYVQDVNYYPSNLSIDRRLSEKYHNYLKDKRVKNSLFSIDSNV